MVESTARTCLLLQRFRPALGGRPDMKSFRELFYFGGGFTLAKIANYFANHGDYLVVGHWLGPSALGIYGRAYQLMAAPLASFGTVLDQVLFPAMARVQAEVHRVAGAYRRGTTLMALVILPTAAAAMVLAPEVVLVILGPQWAGVIPPFRILAAAIVFQNNSKLGDALARAMGAVYRRAWRQTFYALFVIGGAYVGHFWGVIGVAYGVTLAITLNFLLMTHLSLSLTRLGWLDLLRAHLPGLCVAAVASGGLWMGATMLRLWGLPPIMCIAGALAVALTCSLTSIWLWPTVFLGPDAPWILATLQRSAAKARRLSRPLLRLVRNAEGRPIGRV